ncbi:MAG: AraC family transcriptional regulator [Roseburia sp.]|uniref:AraC family transcriptional regulator n=1 Tax=Roseburia sp. 831b TaxID=1261635 RepID=UPI000951A2EF|nr:AraC family transcriptional regulator [Roseburia sp. 831b]MCI5920104.1 AraC family transcriptional regulator [Roseburia sp.]MDY5882341.1 AraC family transcriptional regulator [Roseburia sp.]WVK72665.1 AraC family transcriptional regulator [Roseburia sp. 831b]
MRCRNDLIENFNPTFLFIWSATRTHDELSYHSHDHIEMDFILSGNGTYLIDDNYYEVSEGDLIILNPGCKHQSLVTSPGHPATEFFVGFSDVQFRGYEKNMIPLPSGNFILHTTGELRQKLFKICTSMSLENMTYQEGRYFMLQSYLMQMLLIILREQFKPEGSAPGCSFDSTNKKYVVEQIVNYFEDHYAEKISLDRIAENMYLSPFYISKIFKSETGDTPIRHLINIRLEKAKELLENGWNGSIQEVASSVGYDDVYHFSKLFKKKYGVSPSKIKKEV